MSKRATDGSLLDSLPWTIGAMAFALLPHVPYVPFWVTAAMVLSSVWRYTIERRRGLLPHVLARSTLALACFGGILVQYGAISGVGPGAALLAVMGAMKLLETRQRRDQFVLLFIAVFLTMSALLREQYLWSLPYLVFSLLLTMTAWLRMSADPQERITQSAATSGRMLMYAAPVAIAMWIFFPRIATPFWSVPIDTGAGITGISNNMSPGDVSSLSQSGAVAFRVRFDGEIPAQRDLYWRALVLDRFNGREWNGSDEIAKGVPVRDQVKAYGEPTAYSVQLEPTNQHWLVALDMPFNWDLPDSHMGRQQQLERVFPVDQLIDYTVVSFFNYRVEDRLTEFWRDRYLRLPETNTRTRELAKTMRAEAGDDETFIRNVLERFTNEDYYYTLQPPPLGSNPVDRFMFETRQGFCEHYASAFGMMMRSAGIPSRVVLGYQGGEVNLAGGDPYLIVRQADAHAWNEVWLDGIGWRRVDPTAAVAPERVEVGRAGALFDGIAESWGMSAPSEFLRKLQLSWDAFNMRWNDWILGYGPDQQETFMEWLGMDDPSWRKMIWTMIALVATLVFGISLLMIWRNRPPRADKALRLYRRFVRRTGLELVSGETPQQFAERARKDSPLHPDSITDVTDLYLSVRYGSAGDEQLDALRKAVRAA